MNKKTQGLLFVLLLMIASEGFSNTLKTNLLKYINKNANIDTINAGLKVPAGFVATKIADNVGKARHLVVMPQGTVYVKSIKKINGKGILN